jgi:LPXTG-site transpeptidase (sortase) family protein
MCQRHSWGGCVLVKAVSLDTAFKYSYHHSMKSHLKKLLTLLLSLLSIFLVLNYQYLYTHIKFKVNPPKTDDINTPLEEIKLEPSSIKIPSLNITVPIIQVTETSETAFQKALQDGVVQFPGTAKVGELGNSYVFGHSSDYPWSKGKFKTVFALLPQIKISDTIYASNQDGKVFKYQVLETKVVSPTDLSVLDQQGNKKKLLTLQTSYPVGTALKRFIVVSELLH